jgi:hypothetical protein
MFGRESAVDEHVVHAALEIGEQLLALAINLPCRDRSRRESGLHGLDERDALLGHLVVPCHELADLRVGDVHADAVLLELVVQAREDP